MLASPFFLLDFGMSSIFTYFPLIPRATDTSGRTKSTRKCYVCTMCAPDLKMLMETMETFTSDLIPRSLTVRLGTLGTRHTPLQSSSKRPFWIDAEPPFWLLPLF